MRPILVLLLMLVTARVAAQSSAATDAPTQPAGAVTAQVVPEISSVQVPGLVPRVAADVRPSTGLAKRIAGWVVLGWSMGAVAQIALCNLEATERFAIYGLDRRACTITASALAVAGLAVSVPLLVVGYRQRARYADWRARNGRAGLGIDVGDVRRHATLSLSYRASF